MDIGLYSFDQFKEKAQEFHGFPAPGLMLGAYMVEYAKSLMTEDVVYDAIVETGKCLPDAVQLLTMLSVGNNWMKVVDVGRYALSLYDKQTGAGWRVYVDPEKLKEWPLIESWLLKRVPKKEQDTDALLAQIETAGHTVYSSRTIQIHSSFLGPTEKRDIVLCPKCGEYYPLQHGNVCRGCQGKELYI